MFSFDEATLVSELEKLPGFSRIAFAAAAATRQLSIYEWYAHQFDANRQDRPREIAVQLWAALYADSIERTVWVLTLDEVMGLMPEEVKERKICCALADDALSSLAYAIRALLTSEPQEAAWAARRAYEAADQAVLRILAVQPGLPDTESAISGHPLVQREIARQQRDIHFLSQVDKGSIEEIKKRAFAELLLTTKEQELLDLMDE